MDKQGIAKRETVAGKKQSSTIVQNKRTKAISYWAKGSSALVCDHAPISGGYILRKYVLLRNNGAICICFIAYDARDWHSTWAAVRKTMEM